MNIESLRVFYKTIYYSSISLAAKELFISQPATSLQIKALEKELKLTLLERSNRGVIPTEEGKIVYKYAESILSLYENMIRDAHECSGNVQKRLAISSCATLGQYSLPCSLYEFTKKFQDVEIQTEHTFSYDVIAQVRDRGVDIGFIEGSYSDDNIDCVFMGNTELFFVTSPKLLDMDRLSKDQLSQYSFFLIHRKCSLRKIIEESLVKAQVNVSQLKVNLESPSIEAIKSFVLSGHGISVLPYLSIKKEVYNKSLKIVKVDDISFPYSFSLIYNKKLVKPMKHEFISFMKNEGKNKLC